MGLLRPIDGRRRAIVRLGHPVLREVAPEIPRERFGTRFVRDLERDLLRTMFEDKGVGLAAPQIAARARAFAYFVPGEGDEDEVSPRVVFNPRLELLGEPTELGWEGCLSIPELRGLVPRHPGLVLLGLDRDGRPVRTEADGFHARVIQHEYDHLEGIVFLDRMLDMGSLSYEEEWERFGEHRDLPVEV